MAQCRVAKTCQQIGFVEILFFGTYFAGSDTILVFKLFRDVFEGGTCLAMLKTTLRVGLIVIEAWFRGY